MITIEKDYEKALLDHYEFLNTLKGTKMGIKQDLLDISYKHIIKQGRPSITDTGFCRYSDGNGGGCGAWPFITTYSPDMENLGWTQVVSRFPSSLDERAVEDSIFVQTLQEMHDKAAQSINRMGQGFIENYKHRVELFVEKHGLVIPTLQE